MATVSVASAASTGSAALRSVWTFPAGMAPNPKSREKPSPSASSATAAGVTRQTVHEWLKQAQFVIVLNTGRAELWDAQQNALRALGDKANAVLDAALDSEDGAQALKAAQIVKRAIAADGPPRGPKTAEDWVLSNWSTFG